MSQNNLNGHYYSKNSSSQKQAADIVLCKLSLKGNENVLDIGCGDGGVTVALAEKVPAGRVLGIDPSPSMIEHASKLSNDRISFGQMNALDIKFVNSYDLITCFSCLHWIREQDHVFSNISRALKAEGVFALSCAFEESPLIKKIFEVRNKFFPSVIINSDTPFTPCSKEKFKKLSLDNNLMPIIVEELIDTNKLDVQTAKSWLVGWLPLLLKCSKEEELELSEIVMKEFTHEDSFVYLTAQRLCAQAKKM